MKHISILGSTGSIGTQTLDIVRENPHMFKVVSLSANKNIELLKKQIDEFKPEFVVVYDEKRADELRCDVPVHKGMQGLIKAATDDNDAVVNSLVGSIGVMPTYQAIKAKKDIALANKETLVTAGSAIMEQVKKNRVKLMPIDSEHSAIFQCLNGEDPKTVDKIIITCSGGAFRGRKSLEGLRAEDALKHPTWDMGAKITIDSATLMNKGFEVIEAHWLYGVDYPNIDVVIHPQSIIHSLVEFNDHSVMAQLGLPDMRIPIQYALAYPKRLKNNLKSLDLKDIGKLDFKRYDKERFPCLDYAYHAGKAGGTMPAVMNAANETAVSAFLKDKIEFLDIAKMIKKAMDEHRLIKNPGLDEILEADKKVKEELGSDRLR